MNFGDRIKKNRKMLGLSQADLAKLCGWDNPMRISHYESNKREPIAKDLEKIAKALNTTPEWLLFGVSKYPVGHNSSITIKSFVPLLEWAEVSIPIDLSILKDKNKELIPMAIDGNEKCFALKIKGDSMISPIPGKPSFSEDNIIIVDPEREARHGDYVIAMQENAPEPIFKQFVIDGNMQYLRPLNPQYPLIPMNELIQICGVVIAYMNLLV